MTAQHNADGTADFGPYLVGVPLPNLFTATITQNPGLATGVKYSIDGLGTTAATRVGQTNQWTFDPNVAKLSAGNHQLTVMTTNGQGDVLSSSMYTIKMQGTLNFSSLTASYPGGPGRR